MFRMSFPLRVTSVHDPDGRNVFSGDENLGGIKCSKIFKQFLAGTFDVKSVHWMCVVCMRACVRVRSEKEGEREREREREGERERERKKERERKRKRESERGNENENGRVGER